MVPQEDRVECVGSHNEHETHHTFSWKHALRIDADAEQNHHYRKGEEFLFCAPPPPAACGPCADAKHPFLSLLPLSVLCARTRTTTDLWAGPKPGGELQGHQLLPGAAPPQAREAPAGADPEPRPQPRGAPAEEGGEPAASYRLPQIRAEGETMSSFNPPP